MDFPTAQRILEKEIDIVARNEKYHSLMVEFMGGEPLTNFELIKDVVEWLESLSLSFPWYSFATTNATLLDEERKAWFYRHRDSICLGGSYDGDETMQETNRKTGGKVSHEFLHSTWPGQEFRITISRETLKTLANGVKAMMLDKGYPANAALAQGEAWKEEDADVYYRELTEIGKMFLENPELDVLNLLNRPMMPIATIGPNDVQKRFCGAGKHMVAYDVDGESYGCHMFSPVVLGEKALKNTDTEWEDDGKLADPTCGKCILRNYCPTCAGFNYRYRGSIANRDKSECRLVLAQALASCEFQMQYLATYRERLDEKEAGNAKSAIHVYPRLQELFVTQARPPYTDGTEKESFINQQPSVLANEEQTETP